MTFLQSWIPNGPAGTAATLRLMGQLVRAGSFDVQVREMAAQAVQGAGSDHARIERLNTFLTRHTEFLPDPLLAEALVPATIAVDKIHANGLFQGDCDDVAVVTAALGLSIGLMARFVAVSFDGVGFAHVWTELASPQNSQWFAIDPTRPAQNLPAIYQRMIMAIQ